MKKFIKNLMSALIEDSKVGIGNETDSPVGGKIDLDRVNHYCDCIINCSELLNDLDGVVDSGDYPSWIKEALSFACPRTSSPSEVAEMLINWHIDRMKDEHIRNGGMEEEFDIEYPKGVCKEIREEFDELIN